MATTSKIDEAKELIKAGLKRELILKITSISEHEYSLLQRELLDLHVDGKDVPPVGRRHHGRGRGKRHALQADQQRHMQNQRQQH